ncbi:hypothetical protein ACU5EH_08880 [Aliivibrio salmonicida]|uniref:hypothetical protein n=1 Tax=Aliivibrio salmonicida TaxID=40269 RepID=UPI00406C08FA
MYKIISLIALFFINITSASQITDKVWHTDEISSILNSNLVMNGDMYYQYQQDVELKSEVYDNIFSSYKNGSGTNLVKVLPCWDEYLYANESSSQGSLIKIDNRKKVFIARAIQYYFSGDEDDYEVNVEGEFSIDADLGVTALICTSDCKPVEVKLTRTDSNNFSGTLKPGPKSSYIPFFMVSVTEGVEKISGLSVSNIDGLSTEELRGRDGLSLGMCYSTEYPLQGDANISDVLVILLLNLILTVSMLVLFKKKLYFPLLLTFAFFVTNVFGILFLYWGVSVVRLEQNITNRDILTNIAWFNLIGYLLTAVSYYVICSLFDRLDLKRVAIIKEININFKLAVFIYFCVVIPFIMIFNSGAIDYYLTSSGDLLGNAARASYLRSIITDSSFGLKSHHFRLLLVVVPLFLCLYIINDLLKNKFFVVAFFFFFVEAVILLYNGEKAPLIWFGFSLFYLFLIQEFFNNKWTIPFVSLSFLIVVVVILVSPQSAIGLLIDRTIFGATTVSYYMLELFPNTQSFLLGDSINIMGFKPTENSFNLDLYLWRNIFSSSYYSSLTGTATGTIWTQGYANFGMLGAGLFAFIFGGVVSFFYNTSQVLFKNNITVSLTAWLVFHYSSLGESNLTRYIGDFYLLGLFFILISSLLIVKIFYAFYSVRRL